MYFWPGAERGMNDHLSPVGKPAPPRPRSTLFLSSAMMSSGRGLLFQDPAPHLVTAALA